MRQHNRVNVAASSCGLLVLFALSVQASDSALTTNSLSLDGVRFGFVRISPGVFFMGSHEGPENERPAHPVRIDRGFDIGRTEVTVSQFRVFAEATGYRTDGETNGKAWALGPGWRWIWKEGLNWRQPGFIQTDDHPVVCVSWNDAHAFCSWLTDKAGVRCRLPSEAEWEYACRAGTESDYAGTPNEMGWHLYNARTLTHPVAQKKPNAWGLYDMHGNVWEMCEDRWHANYEGAPVNGKPWAGDAIDACVSRGGAATRDISTLRSAYRFHVPSLQCASINIGFRVVREIDSDE